MPQDNPRDTLNGSKQSKGSLALQLCGIFLLTLGLLTIVSVQGWQSISQSGAPPRHGQPDLDLHGNDFKALVGGISKVIHQSWHNHVVPTKFRPWSGSWRANHPGWQWYLWTDKDNRKLVEQQAPDFLPIYDAFPQHIMRADAARILYMRTYGGCYVDLDFESLRPMDDLISHLPLALGSMGYDSSEHNIPNALMCSAPGHAFWDLCLEIIQTKWADSQRPDGLNLTQNDAIEQITGPRMIHNALQRWALNHEPVPLLDSKHVYPYSWLTPVMEPRKAKQYEACSFLWGPFHAATCKSYFPDAYAITYWTHTWEEVERT